MKRTNYYVLSMLAVSFGLASCELDPYEEPATETYTKEFIKTFGLIDSNQDWNMATRGTVTVNTSATSDVRVYAKNNDGNYSIVADYANVSGEQTLGFDVQRGVTDILVASGSHVVKAQVGGSVNLDSETRTIHDGTSTGGIVVEASDADPMILSKSTIYDNIVDTENAKLPENVNNLGKVTQNFTASSVDGKVTFTMYPIYWNTGNGAGDGNDPDEVGIAYKDDNGDIVHVPIYTLMEGDELQRSTDGTTYTSIGKIQETYNADYSYYKSQGIKVTVPQGLQFAFYIQNNAMNGVYLYSNAEWNPYYRSNYTGYTTTHQCGAATFTLNGQTVLCFEDWYGGSKTDFNTGAMDLNDVVFILDPAPVIVDEDANEWILAGEDLGNIDDYDFNDMVISVSHVSGYNYATVTALAAGGTLPVVLYHGDDALNEGKEFHAWFGDYSSSVMINTSSAGPKGDAVRIDVDTDFSMASNQEGEGKMGGFKFKVTRTSYTGETEDQWNIYAPGDGRAPQLICVPKGWQWPTERTRISDAYPNFGKWGENYGVLDWISNVTAGKVLTNSGN